MLNGKFYTGLPPKMIERGSTGGGGGDRVIDRQVSHFFWPDDTQTESVAETRLRRRTSLQLDATAARPHVEKRLPTMQEQNEVDTRQMFKKEFANSSIQFYDNLQESTTLPRSRAANATTARTLGRRQEVTPKLTETKMLLPKEQAVDEAYKMAKRKQAYDSKIQFYDYMDEDGTSATGNNVRKPKMDMNDKRAVERNSKNSPKLSVKRNVRNLSIERELGGELRAKSADVDEKKLNRRSFDIYELAQAEENAGQAATEERNAIYMLPRPPTPKKILKHATGRYYSNNNYSNNDYMSPDYIYDSQADYIEQGLRELRMRSTPKKHVTYPDESFEPYEQYEERPIRALRQIRTYYDDDYADEGSNNQPRIMPNMRTGNDNQRQLRMLTESSQYMATGNEMKALNNNHINNRRNGNGGHNKVVNNNKKSHEQNQGMLTSRNTTIATMAANARGDATRASSSSTSTALETESAIEPSSPTPLSPSDPRQHLRSSLCFNGDALVVDTRSSTSASTPTSATNARRNARSSATQRVSVGLPD